MVFKNDFPSRRGNDVASLNHSDGPDNSTNTNMNKALKLTLIGCMATVTVSTAIVRQIQAADGKDDPIKQVMKIYHKAPKGVDPICKKASDGKASPAELKNLVAAYRTMAKTKPPKGDDASWKEKCDKLL